MSVDSLEVRLRFSPDIEHVRAAVAEFGNLAAGVTLSASTIERVRARLKEIDGT